MLFLDVTVRLSGYYVIFELVTSPGEPQIITDGKLTGVFRQCKEFVQHPNQRE
jgi:hypothetical protein